MNTKHVLMAMSLPLFFAACTSDEIESQSVNVNEQNRPTVGDVQITLGGDVMSRVADPSTGTVAFTKGMGAVLMDTPQDVSGNQNPTFAQKYALSNTVATDYPFTLKDNVWSTTGLLLEGNYFFYYPVKEEGMARQKFTYEIAENQKAYDAQGAWKRYQPMTDNQMWISYKAFEANTKLDGEKVEISLAPAHARVDFNVVYEGEHEVTINKVVLKPNTRTFMVQGALNVTGAKSAAQYAVDKVDTLAANVNLPALYNVYNNKNAQPVWSKSAYNPLIVANPAFTSVKNAASISVELKGQKLTKGKNVGVTMIVPNTDAGENGYTAEIYTDKGIVTFAKVGNCKEKYVGATEATSIDSISYSELYVGGEWKAETMDTLFAQKNGIASLVFADKAIKVSKSFEAATTADLDLYMSYHEFQDYETPTSLTVTLKSDTVALSKATYDILKANKNIKLTITGAETSAIPSTLLNITSDLPEDAINTVNCGGWSGFVIAEGAKQKMTVKNIKNVMNKGTLTVELAKEGTTVPTATINRLFNVGTVNIKTPLSSNLAFTNGLLGTALGTDNVNVKTAAVINADTTVTADITNYGIIKANVNQAWAYTGKSVKIGKNATTATPSQLTVAAGKTVTLNGTSASTITNNGTLILDTNEGTITNNKNLTVTTNKATINNAAAEADLNVTNNGSDFSKDAVINMVANSYNTVSTNYGIVNYNTEALLQVAENKGINASGNNNRYGHVVYTVTEASTDAAIAEFMANHDDVSKLILNADFTITATALEGTGSIQIARLKYVEAGAINVTVAEGKKQMFRDCPIHFTDNAKIKGAGSINFYEGSPLLIDANKTLILDKTTLNFATGVTYSEAQIKNFGTINHN